MDVRTDVLRTNDFLRTKLFWMRRLPNFLTLCAPLRALCARESSAITLLSNEAYDCQKVAICCSVAGAPVSSRYQKANFCYQNKRRLGNNKTYSFKVAFCSYYQSVFHVLLLLTFWGITIITYFRDFGQTAFYRLSFSILSVKMKFCDPSVLNFKQSKIFKKFLDNPEQAKSIFKILTFKANWKKKNA